MIRSYNVKTKLTICSLVTALGASFAENTTPAGFPAPDAAQKAYDAADLARAIDVYKFFYPTVSGAAAIKGDESVGIVANKVFGILDSNPKQVLFTTNADTPYAPLILDLSVGPLVIELPPGPLIVASLDINQRWVADMGLPGPDAGKGGKHLLVGPDYKGELPSSGYYVHRASSNRQIGGVRALPVNGDVPGAKALLKTVKVYPLNPKTAWTTPQWIDISDKEQVGCPVEYEDKFEYWNVLKETIDAEPAYTGYHNYYGELATLGIEKGKPFNPDSRMKGILEQASKEGIAQMRAQSFADRRPERIVWPDRKWEWAALRYEDGDFNTAYYLDTTAREKWFLPGDGRVACDVPSRYESGLALLARPARQRRRVSGRRKILQAHRAAPGPWQVVLVGYRVRRRYPLADSHRSKQGSAPFVARTEKSRRCQVG